MGEERTPNSPPPTIFFPGADWGPHLHPGAQRPEKLSEALNLMWMTAGDASHLLQMQAKNTEDRGPSVMETLRACDMRRRLCGR